MLGDPFEHMMEIGLRVETVQLRGTDQRIDRRRPFAAFVRTGKQIILASERHRSERPLRGIVVDFQPAVVAVAGQRRPPRQRIPDGLGQSALLRQRRIDGFQPGVQLLKQRTRSCLPDRSAFIGRPAADAVLDAVERTDPLKRLLRQGRAVRRMQIVEFAADMRPEMLHATSLGICCGRDYVAASRNRPARHDDPPFLRNIIF